MNKVIIIGPHQTVESLTRTLRRSFIVTGEQDQPAEVEPFTEPDLQAEWRRTLVFENTEEQS